jgi:hypothetical protein
MRSSSIMYSFACTTCFSDIRPEIRRASLDMDCLIL